MTDWAEAIGRLPPARVCGVVVNVGTPALATLAAASLARHTSARTLLVDAGGDRASRAWFESLPESFRVDVVEAPVLDHGAMLDAVFRALPAELAIVLDSDAEITSADVVDDALARLEDVDAAFGAGFVQRATWLAPPSGRPHQAFLWDRPWMPFVVLRVRHVRAALDHGASFAARTDPNEFRYARWLSRQLAKRLQWSLAPRSPVVDALPAPIRRRLAATDLTALRWARNDVFGHNPSLVCWDTGAELYRWCRVERGLLFHGLPLETAADTITHLEGSTRMLHRDPSGHARVIDRYGSGRLAEAYGFDATGAPPSTVPERARSSARPFVSLVRRRPSRTR